MLGHVACKYIYVRLFRGSDKMHNRSFVSIGSWVAICIGVWIVSWVVAESIPVFNDLLSLIVRNGSIMRLVEEYLLMKHQLIECSFRKLVQLYDQPPPLQLKAYANSHRTVGLPAIFWFHMNQGQYFKNAKKTFLTIINIGVLGIAIAIVSLSRVISPAQLPPSSFHVSGFMTDFT